MCVFKVASSAKIEIESICKIKQNSWSLLSLVSKIHTELILFKIKVVSISESLNRGHISQIKAMKKEYTFKKKMNHVGLQNIMPKETQ